MLIFLAGLQNVPEMLYEAAKVDGANTIHMFFKITLPLVSPVIFYNLIMSMISALQFFTPAHGHDQRRAYRCDICIWTTFV